MNSKVVFMGTPHFAAYILEKMVDLGVNVVGVVTVPDKPAGRGQQVTQSSVKKSAEKLQIPVLQPEKLREEKFIETLQSFDADIFVVIAFRMLPDVVWQIPRLGTFNLHASLLPQYRGAAPINWALLNGETTTGLTTFMIDHQIDTGQILLQKEVPIDDDDNAGTLHDKLMESGPELVLRTIEGLEQNSLHPQEQNTLQIGEGLKEAPKLFKEHGRITGLKTAMETYNQIRGMVPYPGAFLELRDRDSNTLYFKIQQTELTQIPSTTKAGAVEMVNQQEIYIQCVDYQLKILTLQPSGKKSMHAEEFLRGFKSQSTEWQIVA